MTTARRPAPVGVGQVVARMRALGTALPPRDGVAVFNRVYLSVTEELDGCLTGGGFGDPVAAAVLAARFAERYLRAVDGAADRRAVPACWRPLLQLRGHRGIRPVQFALAGINAHVGHDLALAVVDTCTALECEPPSLERDFDRVGDLLTSVEERVREELMPGPDLLDLADPLTHLAGSWSLERARDAAWAASRVLWSLRGMPEVHEEFAEKLDTGVGLVGRFLLTPLGR
ncbi:DUF5995 family protein [Streptomyces sp. NPDC005722]